MQTRQLGKSDLKVSAIGLDCMDMSFAYSESRDKQEMIKLIRTAFDTAEAYGPFENEKLMGEALTPMRNEVGII